MVKYTNFIVFFHCTLFSAICTLDYSVQCTDCTAQCTVLFHVHYAPFNIQYVAFSDPGSMKCSYILEQSPRGWKTTMRQNLVLTIFHTQNICHHAWKTVRITLQCIVGLQLRGEGPEM